MPSLADEIDRIKANYARRDATADYGAQYNAFNALELGYRLQQVKCLAQLLGQAGRRDLAGMRILDFGCGAGRLLGDLLGLGGEPELLCGVDVMPARLEHAREKYPQIEFRQVDGTTLPFPDATFDLVIQSVVFSSMAAPDLRQTLAGELQRVLKPGGCFYWWDLFSTVAEAGRQPLDPGELFPGWPVHRARVAWLPRPSEGLAKRRWKYALGWFVDRFAAKPTHLAALFGPKA